MSLDGAKWVLQEYSSGIRRLSLFDVGVSWLNRNGGPISGKHSHAVGCKVVYEQGLQRFIYQNGICHEGDPSNMARVYEHTKSFTDKDPLLAAARDSMVYGSIAKTHFPSFLQAMAQGCRWDHNGAVMQVPPGGSMPDPKELAEHIRHGIFYHVLRWEAVRDHPEKVAPLMRASNLDQELALCEDEVSLLRQLSGQVHCPPPVKPGQSLWDVIKTKAMAEAGGAWVEDDVCALYNCALTLSPAAVQTLVDCHFQWVNPNVLRATAAFFGDVAEFEAEWMNSRLALLVRQYMCDPKAKEVERVGRHSISVAVKPGHLKALQEDSAKPVLTAVESFLVSFGKIYDRSLFPEVRLIEYMRAQHSLLARCGSVLRDKKDCQDGTVLGKAETEFREMLGKFLHSTIMPDPILRQALGQRSDETCAASFSASTSKPLQLSAPLCVSEGAFQADPAYTLAQQRFVIGCRAVLQSTVSKLHKDAAGTMTGIDKKSGALAFGQRHRQQGHQRVGYANREFNASECGESRAERAGPEEGQDREWCTALDRLGFLGR